MGKSGKGSQFERDVCRRLSEWWSPGNDDLFWRTSQSGGRATVRHRKGKGTRGHCGDICATDSVGEPLVRCITWELKRGYNHAGIFDLYDKPESCGKVWAGWFKQAASAAMKAKTPYWCIVHKRDRRDPIVVFPNRFGEALQLLGTRFGTGLMLDKVAAIRLDDFLKSVDPQDIRVLLGRK